MSLETHAHNASSAPSDNGARGKLCAFTLPQGWTQLTDEQISQLFPAMGDQVPFDMMCVGFAAGLGTENKGDNDGNDTFTSARCVVNVETVSREDVGNWKQTVEARIAEVFPFAYVVDVVEGTREDEHPYVVALSHFIVNDMSLTGMHYSWHQTAMINNELEHLAIYMTFQCPSSLFPLYERAFSDMMSSSRVLSWKER